MSLHGYDVKRPNISFIGYVTWTQDNDFFFSFSNIWYSLFEFNRIIIYLHVANWTKWKKVDKDKVWNSVNTLFKWYLGCRPLRGIGTGGQEEGDGKTLVCDKRTRAINLIYVFCRDLHLTLNFSGLLQNDLFKERWSLEKSYFKQNYSHACHTRLAVFFPLQPCCVSSQITFSTSNNSLDNFTCWYAQFWKKTNHLPHERLV